MRNKEIYAVTFYFVEILSEVEYDESRDDHKETVVEHQAVLAEVFTLQFLLDDDSIASCGQIVQQHKSISGKF